MNKLRYITLGGWQSRTISVSIQHGKDGHLNPYSASDNGAHLTGKLHRAERTRWYSKEHALVRARRIALLGVFYVELQKDIEWET